METVEDINKIFEKYLDDDEVIEYITQNQIFPKDYKIFFTIWIYFCCCILLFMFLSTARVVEMICSFMVIAGISYLVYFLTIKNPYLFFVAKYYCVTNKRLMSYTPLFSLFQQKSLDMVYHTNQTNLRDVTFTNKHHFILFEFKDIPDSKKLCEFMKGKLIK